MRSKQRVIFRAAIVAFLLSCSLLRPDEALAQTPINAPAGWNSQSRASGATQFTPPDLQAGEVYSVTIYDSAPGEGKTLEEYLRKFAGPVGKTAGNLASPLMIQARDGVTVVGTGAYIGPRGQGLGVLFFGVSADGGASIHMSRTLFSQAGLLERYQNARSALTGAMTERARDKAGNHIVFVPPKVKQKIKPGGALVAGVYAGDQLDGEQLKHRLRVYIYPNGEYRITDGNDKDLSPQGSYRQQSVGEYKYNRNNGRLELDAGFDLSNNDTAYSDASYANTHFCYYGRDGAGKPVIYAENIYTYREVLHSVRTSLRWVAPPTRRLSYGAEKARAEATEARKNRQWVVAPGKGVKLAQIAAVLWDQTVSYGTATSIHTKAYLLLKDGTLRVGLPVPPDEMDIARSRQNEPDVWGRWRLKDGAYQVSWDGKGYQSLEGSRGLPGGRQTRVDAHYGSAGSTSHGTGSSFAFWGVTFDKTGRFKKDSNRSSGSIGIGEGSVSTQSGSDENGAYAGVTGGGVAAGAIRKNSSDGSRQGRYSIDGYTLTLRYDDGTIKRLPFFFGDALRAQVWFENDLLSGG